MKRISLMSYWAEGYDSGGCCSLCNSAIYAHELMRWDDVLETWVYTTDSEDALGWLL